MELFRSVFNKRSKKSLDTISSDSQLDLNSSVSKEVEAWSIPSHIRERFHEDSLIENKLHDALLKVFSEWKVDVESESGRKDYYDHLFGRLKGDRERIVPWLDTVKPLKGARVLEIGCGTGASTVALAEQGAEVIGIDLDELSLAVAQERCSIYGLNVKFINANAVNIKSIFKNEHFDFIIFFAVLEHMTVSERLTTLKSAWEMLSPGDLLCVIDTPNRLWLEDYHTSLLPFYHWLPDELAIDYARFSSRGGFNTSFQDGDRKLLDFQRWGRGVSYHEFDLALKPTPELDVVSSLWLFLRERLPSEKEWWESHEDWVLYEKLLNMIGPKIHKGFYQFNLDLIIRKD